ncbi:LCP family protein [Streptomyces sp. NPDC048644]|uniref:LCP family glycopolymer transferase n=1 Tax=Streptomyces sp. NPDC048644 TaxID=3365582 RepID=UPI00371BF286
MTTLYPPTPPTSPLPPTPPTSPLPPTSPEPPTSGFPGHDPIGDHLPPYAAPGPPGQGYDPYNSYDPHNPHNPHTPYVPYDAYTPEPPTPGLLRSETAYAPPPAAVRTPGDEDGYAPRPAAVRTPDDEDGYGPLPGASPGGGAPRRVRRRSRRRRSRGRRALRATGFLLSLVVLGGAGAYAWADSRLDDAVDLSALPGRAAPGQGTNYLIVGSDSRAGLSEEQAQKLHTGSGIGAEGRRTDSMMVLHTGAHGTTMTSLPRDSWITVPAYVDPKTGIHHKAARNKLNAAFSLGGPGLLVRTVESNTGLHIDHYTEIGFAGFVGIVDAVGGVRMCVDRHIADEKSGLDLTRGCHVLDGREALAFVRQRHQEKEGDLGRSRNQQKFLSALAAKAASPDVWLSPSAVFGTAGAGLDTLIVDASTGLPELTRLFKALRQVSSGGGKQLNVPVSTVGLGTSKGSAVVWDRELSRRLFAELRADRPVTVHG